MTYRLDMDQETRVLIGHMSPYRKRRIKASLKAIANDPFEGKPLQDELAGLYSYRIGSLRTIYSVERSKRTVHVVAIGPRRTVYDELERELLRKKNRGV